MADTPIPDLTSDDLFTLIPKEAVDQFWEESLELLADMPPPTDGLIHHYTSIEAAISIIEKQELWSSNIAYLNDSNEIRCAQNVLQFLLSYESRTKGSGDAQKLHKKLKELIETGFDQAIFIVSFCDNGDLLGQWRGYGGGVSIAFDQNEISPIFEQSNLAKVIYDPKKQYLILDSLILSFSSWLNNQKNEADYARTEESLVRLLRNYFENIAAKMKDVSFVSENEWRIVTRRDYYLDLSENPEVHFRTRNQGVVPYIKLQSENGLLPIKGVTVAPNAHPSAESALSSLLHKKGYRGLFIKRSSIPFRD